MALWITTGNLVAMQYDGTSNEYVVCTASCGNYVLFSEDPRVGSPKGMPSNVFNRVIESTL